MTSSPIQALFCFKLFCRLDFGSIVHLERVILLKKKKFENHCLIGDGMVQTAKRLRVRAKEIGT